jgi:hypothetical protein
MVGESGDASMPGEWAMRNVLCSISILTLRRRRIICGDPFRPWRETKFPLPTLGLHVQSGKTPHNVLRALRKFLSRYFCFSGLSK